MPPVILEIRATDDASAVLRKTEAAAQQMERGLTQGFDKPRDAQGRFVAGNKDIPPGLDKITNAAQQMGRGLTQGFDKPRDAQGRFVAGTDDATRSTGSFGDSLGQSLLRTTAQIAGITSLAVTIRDLIGSYIAFDAAQANVNTLIPRQTALQADLRRELLNLPPILGSSAELSKGLYAALSAGVKPSESIKFVADAARLAKAGLSDMDTAMTALTKTMAVYGFGAADATKISDTLFQVVNVGQGSLRDFAGAFPTILVLAKQLGVSFYDASASLATLSASFKNPEQAATGLRSMFAQLIQNSDEFAKRGVNIREVIGSKGLTGALEILQALTGGNAEQMRVFVNDIEGLQAALSLTGPQFQKFIENQGKVREQTAPTAAAFAEQAKAISGTWGTLFNAVGQYVNKASEAVGVTSATTGVLGIATQIITNMAMAYDDVGTAADRAIKGALKAIEEATAGFTPFEEAQSRLTAAQVVATKQASDLAVAYKGLGIEPLASLQQLADGAVTNFATIATSGTRTLTALQKLWPEVVAANIAAYGALPPEVELANERMRLSTEQSAEGMRHSFETLRMQSSKELQLTAQEALVNFKNILDGGEPITRRILDQWIRLTKQINDAGFKTLPPEAEAMRQRLLDTARRLGIELPQPLLDGLNHVKLGFRELDPAFRALGEAVKAVSAGVGASIEAELTSRLRAAAGDAGVQFERVNESSRHMAETVRESGYRAGEGLASGIEHGTERAQQRIEDLTSAAAIMSSKIVAFDQKFSTTVSGLREELARAIKERGDLAFQPHPGKGEIEYYTKYYNELIAVLRKKLAEAMKQEQEATQGTTDALANNATQAAQTTQATQGLISSQVALAGSMQSVTTGYQGQATALQDVIDRQRELLLLQNQGVITDRPGALTGTEPGPARSPGLTGGPPTLRSPGSPPRPGTSGTPGLPPPGSPLLTSTTREGQQASMAPINLTLNITSAMSRGDAQRLIDDLVPALQQAIDRRQVRLTGSR